MQNKDSRAKTNAGMVSILVGADILIQNVNTYV
jgi:hypothetical protein